MALTRKMLKGMGITEEQADTIIEAHTETVDGLKDKLKTAQEKADKLDGVQKELDDLKAEKGDDYKAKYEAEKKAFADYKAEQTAKETKAAKEAAAKAYFEGQKITGANLAIALRGAQTEIAGLELDSDGKIKDAATLEALVKGEFAGLVATSSSTGADPATPPANNPATAKTPEEIYAKDERGHYKLSSTERQEALVKLNQSQKG